MTEQLQPSRTEQDQVQYQESLKGIHRNRLLHIKAKENVTGIVTPQDFTSAIESIIYLRGKPIPDNPSMLEVNLNESASKRDAICMVSGAMDGEYTCRVGLNNYIAGTNVIAGYDLFDIVLDSNGKDILFDYAIYANHSDSMPYYKSDLLKPGLRGLKTAISGFRKNFKRIYKANRRLERLEAFGNGVTWIGNKIAESGRSIATNY